MIGVFEMINDSSRKIDSQGNGSKNCCSTTIDFSTAFDALYWTPSGLNEERVLTRNNKTKSLRSCERGELKLKR